MIWLSQPQRDLLCAMYVGAVLKVHRTVDGAKEHRLHPLNGEVCVVERTLVASLVTRRLIVSNMKFPAAVYLLTEAGVAAAESAIGSASQT